jgi:His-Xaa-Ser system radical SAM maturase HxsC
MLPLDTKAHLQGWNPNQLVKIAGLDDLVAYAHPIERMALDLRNFSERRAISASLTSLPWAGFVVTNDSEIPMGRPGFVIHGDQSVVMPGDVVEIQPHVSKVAVRFRRGDTSNVLFATERCNSYCLMCSQPPRHVEDDWRVDHLCDLISLIDKDSAPLAVSGGEPTLLGGGLVRVLAECARLLPDTPLHILSNGRLLSDSSYTNLFSNVHPSLSWGIPLYGDHFELHDYVVQSRGAFEQTVRGLYALHKAEQNIEIRIVLAKPTVERLLNTVRYIYRNLPFVDHVALMGIEPIGFAKAHHDSLWVDPSDIGELLADAADFLSYRGIPVSLYNLPLCTLPRRAWHYAQRSISRWKQDYLPVCDGCDVREKCAGFFSWVNPSWTSKAIGAIKLETRAT